MTACSPQLLRSVESFFFCFFLFFFLCVCVCVCVCVHTQHSLSMLTEAASFGLSDNVFLPTIQSQATEEQKKKWLPLIHSYTVIGAYAQTEIGHGKVVATYSSFRRSFIERLHSIVLRILRSVLCPSSAFS